MSMTWILVADGSRARLYELPVRRTTPLQIEEFEHPAGRAHNRHLVTDGDGRYNSKGGGAQGHTGSRHERAAEHEHTVFARRLAEHLRIAWTQGHYARLQLVAAPKFLGLLRRSLDKEVDKLVADSVAKDVSWFDEHALAEYLRRRAA